MPPSDLTLQINLSAGDSAYAEQTVPRLVAAHAHVARRIAVVDLCRPQRTRIFDPSTRLPDPGFSNRVAAIRTLAEQFLAAGIVDELVYLEPDSPRFRTLAARYTTAGMTETHDYGGCANMAYWAGIDAPSTRFVLHYDADICLYQENNFDWAAEALRVWEKYPQAVFATPRISPPGFATTPEHDAPSLHEGRPFEPVADGWLNDWFSTRCFLVDRERLAPHLPLMGGALGWEYRLRRLLDRGYPPGPETLLFRRLSPRGFKRLNLSDRRAWILHPNTKPLHYLELLPQLLASVSTGRIPAAQRGHSEIDLCAWERFLRVSV